MPGDSWDVVVAKTTATLLLTKSVIAQLILSFAHRLLIYINREEEWDPSCAPHDNTRRKQVAIASAEG